MAILALLVGAAALIAMVVFAKRSAAADRARAAAAEAQARVEEICAYFADVDTRRRFPAVSIPLINMRSGEFGLLQDEANLFETRVHRSSVGSSVRVAKGVYVSHRRQIATESLDLIARGDLAITNQRVIFRSTSKTVTVNLKDVVAAETDGKHLEIHSEKRQKPITLEFSRAYLGTILVRLFASGRLLGDELPPDVTFNARPASDDPQAVQLAISAA